MSDDDGIEGSFGDDGIIRAYFVLACESCGAETRYAPDKVEAEMLCPSCGVTRELDDAHEIRARLWALDESQEAMPADA